MAERNELPTHIALSWVLGTFHTVALVVALLALAYPGGGVGSLLSSLNTLVGLGLFVALWTATLFTTRRALAGIDWLSDDPTAMGRFFWRAFRWGAVNGLLFFALIAVVQLVTALASAGPTTDIRAAVVVILFYGLLGLVVAAAIGSIVGVALGALDIAALRIARSLTDGVPDQGVNGRI
jgi:hypothetical protein